MRPNHDHTDYNPGECAEVREQLDAWALGALEPAETAAIERHLARCAGCRAESERWQGITGALPLGLDPVEPSQATRKQLMQRIADDQLAQHPPTSAPRLAAPAAAASGPGNQRRFHWSQLLAVPLALALVVMTVWASDLQRQLDDAQADVDRITSLVPGSVQAFQMQSECEQCETTGRLLADPQRAEAIMVAWGLDPGEVHEVWCEEGNGARTLVANLETNDIGEVVQPLSFDQPIAGYKRIFVMSQDGEVVEIHMKDLVGDPGTPEAEGTRMQ